MGILPNYPQLFSHWAQTSAALVAHRQALVLPERPDSFSSLSRWQVAARRALSVVGLPFGDELLGHWNAYILEFFGVIEGILAAHEVSDFDFHLDQFPFERMIKTRHPHTQLNVQYRMALDIGGHASEAFYGSNLITDSSCANRPKAKLFA